MKNSFWFLIFLIFIGCVYSFTGSSVPVHMKTIAIPLLQDQSGFGEPNIKEEITKKLTDLFINDNTLSISDRTTADAIIEGTVVAISDAPSVIEKGERVDTRRITISTKITFQDLQLRKIVWEKDFANWGDYKTGDFTKRQDAISEAIRKITEDVFIQTVSNW
ncbi:MAG: LptE family protein [Bacteroidetes bacterium]|nr:LptE family protein [Bacteroidota bacterium]